MEPPNTMNAMKHCLFKTSQFVVKMSVFFTFNFNRRNQEKVELLPSMGKFHLHSE